MSSSAEQICLSTLCCCCCFLVILIINGFSSLEVNEMGLNFSSLSKSIENKTYTAGFYFLGVGHSFIRFPRTLTTIEYSSEANADFPLLVTRTSDGLEVQLEISFQYRFIEQKLFKTYHMFKDSTHHNFIRIAMDVLSQNATGFSAYEFFVNRTKIGNDMQEALNRSFVQCCHAEVELFQLRNVDLPDDFEDAIQLTDVHRQNIMKAEALKNKSRIEFQTLRMAAEYKKNVTINQALGDASYIVQSGSVKASSILTRQHSYATQYSKLKKSLNLSNDEFLDYLENKVVREYSGNDIMVSLPRKRKSRADADTSTKSGA